MSQVRALTTARQVVASVPSAGRRGRVAAGLTGLSEWPMFPPMQRSIVGAMFGVMRRRRFLAWSVGSGLALAGLGLWSRSGPGPGPEAAAALGSLGGEPGGCFSSRQLAVLQAAALRILDGAEPAPSADGAVAQCRFIDRYVAGLAAPLQDDLRAVLTLLEYAPVVGYAARFTRLSDAQKDAVLRRFESSQVTTLRQAFMALKSLCCLAHYQDERSFAALGYSGPLVRP